MEERGWLAQQLDLLLHGYGYNLYDDRNRARADDLLVRQRAGELLGQAASHLTRLATEYHARCVPPSTREQPFPPPEITARLRLIETVRGEVSALAASIRGMPAPTQDQTWERIRIEERLLRDLLSFDHGLVKAAAEVEASAAALEPEAWSESAAAALRARLDALRQSADARARLLSTLS